MSARSPLICSAVELWYKKMLKIGSLSELTGIDTKIKVAGFQRLYSKWLWLLMAVYKPSFADAKMLKNILEYHIIRHFPCNIRNEENTLPYILRKKISGYM
ncbi:MAG: hypothetical protein BACB_03926 [Bacteroides thetaiotaomicron]